MGLVESSVVRETKPDQREDLVSACQVLGMDQVKRDRKVGDEKEHGLVGTVVGAGQRASLKRQNVDGNDGVG